MTIKTFLISIALFLLPLSASAAFIGRPTNSLGMVGYWTFDGSQTNWATGKTNDSSGQGNTGQLISFSTTTSPVSGKVGQALNFNGSSSFISVAHNALFNPSFITISLWLKTSSSGVVVPINHYTNSGAFPGFSARVTGGKFGFWVGGSAWTDGSITVNDGKWHLVVGTYDGVNTRTYVDGMLDATQAQTANFSTSVNLAIGSVTGGASNFFPGYIDDVRVYTRALPPDEVKQIYTAGSATAGHSNVAVSSGLTGYWTLDGNQINWDTGKVFDSSGSGNTGFLTSMSTTSSPTAGKIGGALKFNGTSEVTNFTSSISSANTTRTVCAWIMSTSTTRQGVVSNRPVSSGWALTINRTTAGNLTYINDSQFIEAAGGITTNKWYDICASYDASNQAVVLYVNGAQVGSGTIASADGASGNNGFIGFDGLGTFQGSIDDVRVYNRVLVPNEIKQIYQVSQNTVGHSNTGTNAVVGNGLVGYWTFDGSQTNWATGTTNDSSGNGNTGQLIAMSTSTSPVAGRIGGALKFNGTTQYVNKSGAILSGVYTNWTVTAWIKTTEGPVNGNGRAIYSERAASGNDILKLDAFSSVVCVNFSIFVTLRNDAGTLLQGACSSKTINDGKWHLVAMTLSGVPNSQTASTWVDGLLSNSATWTGGNTFTNAGRQSRIAGDAGDNQSWTQGTLDDVRVYNRALSAEEMQQLYNAGH